MADLFPTPLGFNGINLDNYFPNQRSYNSVVYVHKRFLANPKEFEKEAKKQKDFKQKVTKCNDEKIEQCDKGIQFDGVKPGENINKRTHTIEKTDNDVTLNQTVQFAKNIVPLLVSSENYDNPVFYTVKTKKCKKKPPEYTNEKQLKNVKNKVKKLNDTSRKAKVTGHMESISIKESVSHSSQNTLDDFNINESLTCTISGISERIYVKKETDSHRHKKSHNKKITVSNSFEALATETLDTNERANIKIHLMNDEDKTIFTESLQKPIINAIKECISELNQHDKIDKQFKEVQRFIKCNNEKLDHIFDRVSCIEKQIESQAINQIEIIKPPNVQPSKSSKLEQLGEDLVETRDSISEGESMEFVEKRKTYKCKSVIATLDRKKSKEENMKTLGGGEVSSPLNEVPIKHDRPNRIPTRFCWTDAERT